MTGLFVCDVYAYSFRGKVQSRKEFIVVEGLRNLMMDVIGKPRAEMWYYWEKNSIKVKGYMGVHKSNEGNFGYGLRGQGPRHLL